MKTSTLLLGLLCFVLFVLLGRVASDYPLFYDGEGNKLPTEAVQALVKSQYTYTTPKEDSLINVYFK